MTQLYVGNLSAEADEKAVRSLFGKFGPVREVLMKSGYAFVEFESPLSGEEAMRELNGSDILGHPMIVEPSHQQRLSSRRKGQCGRVEVTDIPVHLSIQNIETMLSHMGQVFKMEIEEGEYGMKKIVATFETHEQAQKAAAVFSEGNDHTPRVTYIDGMRSIGGMRKGSPGIPTSPSKNSDFPLRILVPGDMVGAIIGKDGATIRMITQITKARVDVHRRENLGTAEKAITIIGPPECCTEACYQIMKIMQSELLMTSGMLENGAKFHEPLPVVPLKVLAHNELVGRVIGKGGNTLKRIMAESGTKITISKLKDLTAYNMERTITILGTIDNCKKAESLISAKLRASYESDMAQFIPVSEQGQVFNQSPSPTNIPPPLPGPNSDFSRLQGAQSLPATPSAIATNVRTFTDFSGEHTRLTTLHGSAGALEVNNLGGFRLGPLTQQGQIPGAGGNKHTSAFETTIDGIVKSNGSNGHTNGIVTSNGFSSTMHDHMGHSLGMKPTQMASGVNSPSPPQVSLSYNAINHTSNAPPHSAGPINHHPDFDDEISDVFSGLSLKDPFIAAPGYGRFRPRRSSAPVGLHNGGNAQNGYGLWGPQRGSENPLPGIHEGMNRESLGMIGTHATSFVTTVGSSTGFGGNGWGVPPSPVAVVNSQAAFNSTQPTNTTQSIWSNGSRPNSEAGSYSNSEQSSLSGFSPIYSPTNTSAPFGFPPTTCGPLETISSSSASSSVLLTSAPMMVGEDRLGEIRSPFKASVPTPLTTVSETTPTVTSHPKISVDDDDLFQSLHSATLELLGDSAPQPTMVPPISVGCSGRQKPPTYKQTFHQAI